MSIDWILVLNIAYSNSIHDQSNFSESNYSRNALSQMTNNQRLTYSACIGREILLYSLYRIIWSKYNFVAVNHIYYDAKAIQFSAMSLIRDLCFPAVNKAFYRMTVFLLFVTRRARQSDKMRSFHRASLRIFQK